MSFGFLTLTRILASIGVFVGLFLHSQSIVLFSWEIAAISYVFSISMIEKYLESQPAKED